MKLASYLDPKFVYLDLEYENIDDAIEYMVNEIGKHSPSVSGKELAITKTITTREHQLSTSIGHGVIVPHGKLENFDDFIIAAATLKNPISSQIGLSHQTDNTKLIILILTNINNFKYVLKTTSAFSKLFVTNPELLEKIKLSSSKAELISFIETAHIELIHSIVAEDIMDIGVIPATLDNSLELIGKRFIVEQLSGIPTVDKDGLFLGEITERELIELGLPKYTNFLPNVDFLTLGITFDKYLENLENEKDGSIEEAFRTLDGGAIIDKNTPVMEICSIIAKKGISRIYVVENKKYLGMIRRSDIIRKIIHL